MHASTQPFSTLGARDFSSAVSPLVASAFGQHRKFPPHARKTSGTQGNPFLVCPKKEIKKFPFHFKN